MAEQMSIHDMLQEARRIESLVRLGTEVSVVFSPTADGEGCIGVLLDGQRVFTLLKDAFLWGPLDVRTVVEFCSKRFHLRLTEAQRSAFWLAGRLSLANTLARGELVETLLTALAGVQECLEQTHAGAAR